MQKNDPRRHLVVALDVPTSSEALELARDLADYVGVFKVGLQLYTSTGPKIVEEIQASGGNVFLDLKLHDIPNTVSKAVLEACKLGVHMLTLHAAGGPDMMQGARDTADEWIQSSGRPAPHLLGVTVLTSLSEADASRIGFGYSIEDMVVNLARLADDSGLNGIVCSPLELDRLVAENLKNLFFVTPGIRPTGTGADDQARTKTPAQAISSGSKYLVIGRPITGASDPVEAAKGILSEIQTAKERR
jgi:orotidine-5'-phosphate decarboxylase